MAHSSQLWTNIDILLIKVHIPFGFLWFSPIFFFCFTMSSRVSHYAYLVVSIGLSSCGSFFQLSLLLMALTVLRSTDQEFCKMPLNCDLSDAFLWGYSLIFYCGEVLFSSCDVNNTYYEHDISISVNLDHLAEVVFVRFLYCKHTLFSPFHNVLFKWKLLCTAHTERVIPIPHILMEEYLYKLFKILLQRALGYSSFVYLLNYLFI